MNGVGRITENKWMRRLRSDLRIVLDLILRSDLRFGLAQNEHLVVRTDGHWPFRASGLLEPLARLAKEGEHICRASGPAGLASKTLSNSFSTRLSRVIPLYFPGSCTSPFLFHIISALSGPSSTLSVSFPPAYTRSVAFLST